MQTVLKRLLIQQFFQCGQLQTDGEHFHCLVEVFHRGQAGSQTQMVVVGVKAVGVGSTGGGQHNTGFPAQAPGALGSTGHGVQGYEVAAAGIGPVSDVQILDLLVQPLCQNFKLGSHDGSVTLHDLQGVLLVLQILHVTQLVDLVVGDHLHTEDTGEVLDIGFACCHAGGAAAGEGDLGGGSELINHVGVACFGAQGDDVGEASC